MARYTGAVCRQCRREGMKLFLKGERCYSGKCAIDRRSYAPGQHGQSRKKYSEYGLQLREKQKVRRYYGCLLYTSYSSVGRAVVSKTTCRGFKSFCPCQICLLYTSPRRKR